MEEPASVPPARAACLLHIRVGTSAVFGDEAVDPHRDNRQRYRAALEHGLSPRAAVAKALAGQGSVETLNR